MCSYYASGLDREVEKAIGDPVKLPIFSTKRTRRVADCRRLRDRRGEAANREQADTPSNLQVKLWRRGRKQSARELEKAKRLNVVIELTRGMSD